MAILAVTLYTTSRLAGFGVKNVQFSSFVSIALTIGLSIFYILCYIDPFTGFHFTCFSFPVTISLGILLSNATNESITLEILLGSLLALYYIVFMVLFAYNKLR